MKCAILIDEELPLGLIANTASVLSLTIGEKVKGLIGYDLQDNVGRTHAGITTLPIPILKSKKEALRALREKLYGEMYHECLIVDFTNVAQRTKTYDDYAKQISETPAENLSYLGIAIYGPKKKVNSLVGNIGLLR